MGGRTLDAWRGRLQATRFALVASLALAMGIAGTTAGASADGLAELARAAAGNGGVAGSTGSATITTGDIITGMNTGSDVSVGDIHAETVSIEIGDLSNETDQDFNALVGPQNADASGGADSLASLGLGQPTDIGITVDTNTNVRNNNDNNNDNDNDNDNTNIDGILAFPGS